MAIGFSATGGKPPTCHGRAEKGAKKCTIDGMAEEDMCWKLTIHVASGVMENMKTWNIHEVAMEGGKIIGVLVDFPWFSWGEVHLGSERNAEASMARANAHHII